MIDDKNILFTKDTKLRDLKKYKSLAGAADYLFGHGEKIIYKDDEMTLQKVQEERPTWGADDAVYGMNRLLSLARSGKRFMYSVYSDDEIKKERDKEEVKLFYFPAEGDGHKQKDRLIEKPYVVLAAGGAYFGVCSMVEAFPVAAMLNEKGYNVFCLNYRVSQLKLMPKPLNDMAAAMQFIKLNKNEFGIQKDRYIVGGFSAGGNLAALWGTISKGYANYGLTAPEAVLLGYPLVSAKGIKETMGAFIAMLFPRMLYGLFANSKVCDSWALENLITKKYPPTYICMAKDDDTIPQTQYHALVKALKENRVNHSIEWVETGSHGYGLGTGTAADGWVDRAVDFMEKR